MAVTVRRANPLPAEAAVFARLANMASHDILANLIGPDHEARLAARFLHDDALYSHRLTSFVEANGEIVAMLCGFTERQKATLPEELDDERTLPRPESAITIQRQLQPVFDFIDTVPEAAWYVQFLAVAPHARGNGYAGQLMAHAEELAREAGAATLELDVETGNAAALAAYQRAGLAITRTSVEVPYDAQRRTLAMHRMVKPLA